MKLNRFKLAPTYCADERYEFQRELYFYGFNISDANNPIADWANT